MPTSRRRFLALSAGALTVGTAGCLTDAKPEADPSPNATPTSQGSVSAGLPDSVTMRRVAHGFASPIGFETLPGRPGEWTVVDQDGRAWLYDGSEILDEPLLDVRELMVDLNDGYDESGLLGMAFHPDFQSNGKLYARYSSPRREGTPSNYDHTFVLAEFTMDPAGDTAPLDSERTVLEIPEPQGNHNSGAIAFGPEGYLFVGVGDGGKGHDNAMGHVEDWYDAVEGGNGQDVTENLLGSVLRIDVDGREDGKGYAIPDDNPLVGREGLDEHYAWGFRNPWRLSVDGDDLFVADVGQNTYEEVNLVEKGGNYGWNVKEATECHKADACPSETDDGTPLRDPILSYKHQGETIGGRAVIGGYRYHGSALPGLQDTYVFADWVLNEQLYVGQPRETGQWSISAVSLETATDRNIPAHALAFGRTHRGELMLCTSNKVGPVGDAGSVYRLE